MFEQEQICTRLLHDSSKSENKKLYLTVRLKFLSIYASFEKSRSCGNLPNIHKTDLILVQETFKAAYLPVQLHV